MKRRELIAASGIVLTSLSGCATRTVSNTTTSGEHNPSNRSSTEPDRHKYSLSVSLLRLQPGVVVLYEDSYSVHSSDNQYLILQVRAAERPGPDRNQITFNFGGRSFPPFNIDTALQTWWEDTNPNKYDSESGEGWLMFAIPDEGGGGSVSLSWPGGEWEPSPRLRKRLRSPPASVSVEFKTERTVSAGEYPELTFQIKNNRDVPRRFITGLN